MDREGDAARVVVVTEAQLEELLHRAVANAAQQVMQTQAKDRGLRVADVADRLACAESTVYGMIQRGELQVIRLGTAIRVPESSLEQWIKSAAR